MGKRAGGAKKKKNQAEGPVIKSPCSKAKGGTTEASSELINVAVVEYGSPQIGMSTRRSQRLQNATSSGRGLGIHGGLHKDLLSKDQIAKDGTAKASRELIPAADVVENRSLQIGKSIRRSQQLLKTPSSAQDLGTQSQFGEVEVVLELEGGTIGSGAEAEQDLSQSPVVKQKESKEIERILKLVEEQRIKIDELQAAGKSFSLQDVISAVEIRRKEKANKYKDMYLDAQDKIHQMQQEKYEQAKKVECANARLEGYEMGQQSICGVIDKLRDTFLLASVNKPTANLLELASTGNGGDTLKRSNQTKPQAARRDNATGIVKLPTETNHPAAKRKRLTR